MTPTPANAPQAPKKRRVGRIAMETTTQNNQIVNGVVWKQMLLFFFPIFLGTLFQQFYSMIDAVILGRFVGKEALAAVGGSDIEVINLLVNFFVGLSSGASVVISQHYGARHQDALRSSVYTAMALAVGCGALLTLLGVFCSSWILQAIHTPADIFRYAEDYMRYYFLGMIPSMIYNMGSGILRAVGDSRRPLYYLIVCCFVNIVLDLFLVLVIPLATAGTAIATSISQLVCASLVLRALLKTRDIYQLQLSRRNFSRSQLKHMLRIGLPAGLQSSMYSISNVFIQSSINRLGTDSVAAWAAFRKIDSIYWPISNALGITVMTFVGQNFGARRYDRLRQSVRSGLVLDIGITVLFSAAAVLLRGPLIALFNDDAQVLRIGEHLLLLLSPYYILYLFSEIYSGAMRGVGESLWPALLTLFGTCVLRLGYLFLFVNQDASNAKIAFSYPLTWAVTSVMFIVYYFRGHWLSSRIRQNA